MRLDVLGCRPLRSRATEESLEVEAPEGSLLALADDDVLGKDLGLAVDKEFDLTVCFTDSVELNAFYR